MTGMEKMDKVEEQMEAMEVRHKVKIHSFETFVGDSTRSASKIFD